MSDLQYINIILEKDNYTSSEVTTILSEFRKNIFNKIRQGYDKKFYEIGFKCVLSGVKKYVDITEQYENYKELYDEVLKKF